jgi:hypothetical protein
MNLHAYDILVTDCKSVAKTRRNLVVCVIVLGVKCLRI